VGSIGIHMLARAFDSGKPAYIRAPMGLGGCAILPLRAMNLLPMIDDSTSLAVYFQSGTNPCSLVVGWQFELVFDKSSAMQQKLYYVVCRPHCS